MMLLTEAELIVELYSQESHCFLAMYIVAATVKLFSKSLNYFQQLLPEIFQDLRSFGFH